jgi:4,5-dihydroxyphthalate decarboxylase
MQSHHMVVVNQELTRRQPDAVRELWRMLLAAKAVAQVPDVVDPLPYGFGANWDHLAAAIEASFRLGFIPERIPVEALFDDVTVSLPPSV